MKRQTLLTHEFVEFIPDVLQEGTVYVSIPYMTAVHKCCCGCGREVVTPLSPTGWTLIFDGESISLDPSIGNWSFPCQSHYWIRHNRVQWARRWSRKEIEAGRAFDSFAREKYYNNLNIPADHDSVTNDESQAGDKQKESIWQRLKKWLLT